ncbi:MAG: efflux RND transporter periplasmic adaptor subunit, partial [Acidobacteriota bacterium]|nr:efflux RND transporter periplasmic adaptor subunit [Acidobacteriota bacterium]
PGRRDPTLARGVPRRGVAMNDRISRTAAALLGATAILSACDGPSLPEPIEARVPVQVREVGTGDVEDVIEATGTLRATESATMTVESTGILAIARTASGRRLGVGDRVRAGQLLAEVKGEEVRVAARVDATRERFVTSQRDVEAKERLFDQGLIAELELLQARASLADAKAELERSELTETRTRIISPISGVVLQLARDERGLPIADGQRVMQGSLVAQVAPMGRLVADLDLIGADAIRVRAGMPAEIRHYAWDDQSFSGIVRRLAPTFDPVTRASRAEVEVRNPEARLSPGMFVEARIVLERREGVPVVVREAVTTRGGKTVVFVLEGQSVKQREVRLGLGDDDVIQVTAGLAPGERVVVRGLETLTDGTKVRVSGA